MNASLALSRNKLRKELRQQRRTLSGAYKKFVSKRITTLLERSGWLQRGNRVGVYLATAEELNLQPLIERAWQRGCKVFVPHIIHSRRGTMLFYPFDEQSSLKEHRWGIPQLANARMPVTTRSLDVVLMPLVGFDRFGHRLGMGGGFYDRHFAYTLRTRTHKPFLVGVAYACQEVSAIDVQPHDVRLDAAVTENAFIRF